MVRPRTAHVLSGLQPASHPSPSTLQLSEGVLDTVQRVAQLGSWHWNLIDGTHAWSAELFRIFGHGVKAVTPTYDAFLSFVHPDDRAVLDKVLFQATQSPDRFTLGVRLLPADDATRIVHLAGEVLLDTSGNPSQLICTVQDVTDRSSYQNRRDEHLAIVTHDLKNAIAIIRGHAQFQHSQVERPIRLARDRLMRGLRTIDTAAAKMMTMIDEVLDVAQLQEGHALTLRREAVNVLTLITERVAAYQQLTQLHTLQITSPATDVVGQWDRGYIARALDNLLSNAIKFSPQGGVIRVMVGMEFVDLKLWSVISVADPGSGNPSADVQRLGAFVQRDEHVGTISGTGRGLISVRQIVAEHGGTLISSNSNDENGRASTTTVTIRLPLAE